MTDVVRTWFAKGSSGKEGNKASKYFVENNCLSCGWSLEDVKNREVINNNLDNYKRVWQENYGLSRKWGNQGVKQLFDNLKKGDFVWTRNEGIYYLAQIKQKPKDLFRFDISQKALDADCSAQLKDIEWKRIGTEESVPGSISTYTRNIKSLVRKDNKDPIINNMTSLSLYSASLLNEDFEFSITDREDFFKFLDSNSVEDLCALWLYSEFSYVVIPSTNKRSTEKYEFVLVDPNAEEQKLIYIQVKNGLTPLNPIDYEGILNNDIDELWLFTTRSNIINDENREIQIGCYKLKDNKLNLESYYSKDVLINFATNKSNYNLIPLNTRCWIDKVLNV